MHGKGLEGLEAWATAGFIAASSHSPTRIAKHERTVAGLTTFRLALCDYLVFSANIAQRLSPDWKWNIGDEIPRAIEYLPSLRVTSFQELFIPTVRPLTSFLNLTRLMFPD